MNRRDALSAAAVFFLSALAVGTARPASQDERVGDLVKAGRIRAALAAAPIMAKKDPATGEWRGVAVDLAQELASRIGTELLQVQYPRPGAVMAGLQSNAWDVAFLGIDPARAAEADFTAPYLEVDLTYLVPASSPIGRIAEADKPGIRISVPRGDLVDIILSRELKQATLVRAETVAAAFEMLLSGEADVCAEPRPNLLQDQARMPGSRVLADRFGVNHVGIAVPKGNARHLSYLNEFIESAKASGFVQRAIERSGLRGVQAAPAAKLTP